MAKFLNLLRLRSFATAADTAAEVSAINDTHPRLKIDAGGKLTWGSGSATGDTTLYRQDSGVIATDGTKIILKNNDSGAPSANAILEVERGSSSNVQIRWNETTDKWQFTNDGITFTDFGSGSGASITISDTAPVSATAGDMWFESDSGKLFVYYDSAWVEVGGAGGGGASVTVSDTAPTSPSQGDLWFESDSGKTYVYYDSSWIEVGATASSATSQLYDAYLMMRMETV